VTFCLKHALVHPPASVPPLAPAFLILPVPVFRNSIRGSRSPPGRAPVYSFRLSSTVFRPFLPLSCRLCIGVFLPDFSSLVVEFCAFTTYSYLHSIVRNRPSLPFYSHAYLDPASAWVSPSLYLLGPLGTGPRLSPPDLDFPSITAAISLPVSDGRACILPSMCDDWTLPRSRHAFR